MKKVLSVFLSLCMLLSLVPAVASAADTQVLNGDYVVIVNTNPNTSVTESTGAIVFNSSGDGSVTGSTASPAVSSSTPSVPAITGTPSTATKTYSVNNTITVRGMNYTCVAVGSKCYVWMETSLKGDYDASGKTSRAAQEMLNIYEGKPYSVLNTLADGRIKYLDGSDKLSILMENDPESTAAGYYGMESEITAIHINCPSASSYMSGSLDGRNGLLAHEGQHALFQLLAAEGYSTDGYRWIDEGLAVTAMEWTWGKQPTSQWLSYIEGSSEVRKGSSLVYESYRSNTALDYSLPALYVRYIANRYSNKYAPLMFMQELYKVKLHRNSNADNKKTVEEYLNDVFAATGMKNPDGTTLTFRQSLIDFYVAAVKQNRSGIYSFQGDTTVYNSLKNYPVYMGASGTPVSLAGTAAIVVKTVDGSFTVPASHGTDIKYIAVNKTTEPFKPALGEGTAQSPFVLSTAEEFACAIDQYPDAYFILSNDIDMSKITCSGVDTFSGVLDGKGYTVSGVARAIVYENTGTIKNLNIIGAANDEYLGTVALVAEQNNGMVQDCTVSGTMTPRVIGAGIRYTPVWGTLVAINSTIGTVERCASTANVTVKIDANVSHDTIVGNLIGQNSGVVRDCYTAGSITATRVGNSTASYYVGGVAGVAKGGMSNPFYRCYSVTDVVSNGSGGSTDANVGRFSGSFPYYVYTEGCYSLNTMAALGYRASNAIAVNEKTESELKTQSTYSDWNFSGVWKMQDNGYPTFVSQNDITSVEAMGSAYIFVGQKIDYLSLMGIQIRVNGDNSNLIDMTEDMVDQSTLDSSTAGTKTVSCSYRGKSFTLTVYVSAPSSVSDLKVYQPGKTSYVVGSMYDDSGVVLSAKFNGAAYASYIYSGFTNDRTAALKLGDESVTYTYCSSTVSQSISVNVLGVSGIDVVSTPDKSSYASGELMELTNLGVKLNYNDGTVTSTLEYADLQSKGIRLAKRYSNGIWDNVDLESALTVNDNEATIYLYSGDTLPSDSNPGICSEVMTLTVQERMSLDDQIVVLKLGKAYDYASTEPLKGSGYVTVTKVSGTLPSGVTVYSPEEAGNEYDCFSFTANSESGLTGSVKDYPLVYKITNGSTGQVLYVNITIRVQNKSSVANFEYVKFKASQNSGKLSEDVNGVIDSEAGTVILTVPYGTPQSLSLEYKVAEGGSACKPNGDMFFNGTYNFANTNPVLCKVVAEDGTTKDFAISLVVAPEHVVTPPEITGITNGGIYCLSASFTVSGENITSVTDNGTAISAPYTLTAGSHKIIATNDGGSKEVNITVNAAHTESTAANCHAKAVCAVCSQSYGELNPSNHDGATQVRTAKAATCTVPGYTGDTYCLGCNKVKQSGSVINATGNHTWEQTGVTPATCHTHSVTAFKCSVCNTTKTEEGTTYDASNHDGTTEIRDGVTATCATEGYSGNTYCLGCNKVIATGTVIEKTAHVEGTAANCHAKAVCAVCSQSYGELNPSNHDGATEVRNAKAATCVETGYTGDTYCLGCNKVKLTGSVINATGNHTWEQTGVTPATCHTYSVTAFKCSVCNTTKTEEGTAYDASNHDGTTEIRDGVTATCATEGYSGNTYCLGCNKVIATGTVIEKTAHVEGTAANCHAKAVCAVCSQSYGELNPSNHDGATQVRNAKAATCGAAGYTGDTYCLGCNKVKLAGSVIIATGNHTWEQTGVTPATCHTYSITAFKCSVCNTTKTEEGTAYDASNHDGATQVRNAKSATCGAAGYTGDTYCLGCNKVKLTGSVINATGNHTWEQTGVTPATCHTYSVTAFKCSVCNTTKTEEGTTYDTSNHDGGTEIRDGVTATCAAEGYSGNTYCLGCNKVIATGTVIEKTAHVEGTAANCHAKAVCAVCSQSYGELNPSNHDGATQVRNAKAATCVETGYTGDTYCLGCNSKIEDGTVTAKLSHTPEVRGARAATCTSEGYTGDTYCKVCNTKMSDGTVTAKLSHTPEVRGAIAATCTSEGYTGDTYCKVCNTKMATGTAIAMTAHTVGTAANCHAKAVCAVCRQSFGEINPNNHVNTHVEGARESTYDSEGYTGNTVCDDCGQTIAYGTAIAKKNCSCMCHQTGFMNFIYKIARFFWKLFGTNKTCACGAVHY